MGLFSRSKPNADLEERLHKVERDVRDLKLDWDMTFEKFAKLNARLAKRVKREEQSSEDDAQGTNGGKARVDINPLADRLLHPYRGIR